MQDVVCQIFRRWLTQILMILQVFGILLWGWLGGYKQEGGDVKNGRLLTIEELGEILKSLALYHLLRKTQLTFRQFPSISRTGTSST